MQTKQGRLETRNQISMFFLNLKLTVILRQQNIRCFTLKDQVIFLQAISVFLYSTNTMNKI